MTQWTLGILGGSGLYNIPGLENPEWVSVSSPWGEVSDDILFAEINGVKLRFLPRHGRGHALSPSDVNYRACILYKSPSPRDATLSRMPSSA